ncbi:programmed cell death 6-interacting protein isoform x1 [Diplodia corticola]|uniref:Programmed cell death 6-interacting protein isoform x1 n=1 Tax=Diplodia corticola TaxID=236234 RepID=A0A1J9RME8_9PEZI|nr:programmed cell death 6-interacting protein isoform x1 [Diplodia corticola]OJD29687.1 programmed cell death 6-interacting protein isoform x1 [Diplodia corticola]
MSVPVPIIVCGAKQQLATMVRSNMLPEFNVIYAGFDLAASAKEVPQILSGSPPPSASLHTQVGSNDFQLAPRAVVTGGGYSDEAFQTLFQACVGACGSESALPVPFFRVDNAITSRLKNDYHNHDTHHRYFPSASLSSVPSVPGISATIPASISCTTAAAGGISPGNSCTPTPSSRTGTFLSPSSPVRPGAPSSTAPLPPSNSATPPPPPPNPARCRRRRRHHHAAAAIAAARTPSTMPAMAPALNDDDDDDEVVLVLGRMGTMDGVALSLHVRCEREKVREVQSVMR